MREKAYLRRTLDTNKCVMDQKTESLKHADPWLTIPLLKKRITSHISVKPSCPSFDGYITATNNKYGKRYKQVSCRLWKSRTQRQIFQNTRQQEMLYLSEVTGIKETRKHADRNRTHLTFYSEIIKQKNRNGSIHFPYNHFKHKTVQKRAQNLSLQDREDIRHTLQEREKPA